MPSISYRVRIVRSGEEFEAEGDKGFVLQMLKRFDTGKAGAGEDSGHHDEKPTGRATRLPPSKGKPLSVGEFIRQVGFRKHTDIVLAFGYYLETYSSLKDFAPADLNACYYDAKLEPSNTSQMIIQNIKRGFIMQSKKVGKGDKRYLLTQSGVDYVSKPKK